MGIAVLVLTSAELGAKGTVMPRQSVDNTPQMESMIAPSMFVAGARVIQ